MWKNCTFSNVKNSFKSENIKIRIYKIKQRQSKCTDFESRTLFEYKHKNTHLKSINLNHIFRGENVNHEW